eukprot:514466_1
MAQAKDENAAKEQVALRLLLEIYQQSPLIFRHRAQNIMSKYKEDIMKWGEHDVHQKNEITEEQFLSYLEGKQSAALSKVIFVMIYSGRDGAKKEADKKARASRTVSRLDVIKFAQGFKSKKHVRACTVKDANWVLTTIRRTDFAAIDKKEDFKIDIDAFTEYFKPMGLSNERIKQIFDEIDAAKKGSISVVQYNKWRSHQKASDLLTTLNR